MIKEDVLQYLKDEFYLVQQGDSWVISNKFTRELGISSNHTVAFTPVNPVEKIPLKPAVATKEVYKQFIQEAKVPSKIETGSGAFWANRYSDKGFKAFKKVMENPDINRAILLASTKWYYAQVRTARVMIGNYFGEGIWESCYDDFVAARAKHIEGKTEDMLKNMKPLTNPKIDNENDSNMEAG